VTTLGPDRATVEIVVLREGLLAAVGHDLLLRATALDLEVDPERPAVRARVAAGSLRVVSALRDGRPLPGALKPRDVAEIEATIAGTVLRARRFPEIRFGSSSVVRTEDGFSVAGVLALAGVEGPVTVPVRREGESLVATLAIHQPDFGIRPYQAMLGALKVRPDVRVRVAIPASAVTPPATAR
jgi:polyisoprenoid-binding protein YceI